jgi:flagellar assembly protein FliH
MSDFSRDTKPGGVEIKSFKPRALNGDVINDYKQVKEKFGNLAATDPKSNSHFTLHPESKRGLGIEAEERSHIEDQVSIEVETRLAALKDEAYQDGFERGRGEGKTSAEAEFFEQVKPQFEQLTTILKEFDQLKSEVYTANEQFLIQLIFQVSKSILLTELKTDREYVKRLTAEIIEKLGAKENIRIKINTADYENIDQFREFLKTTFPDLKNVQIEPDGSLVLGGVKVETDLSRINASVEAQLNSIQSALSGEA